MYGQSPYYPNPMMQTAQQRLQMMEAQYPQFAGQSGMGYPQQSGYANPQAQSPMPLIIKGRPVSNEEEANAAMIDFDGSLFVFPDRAHGKIYTKQLGLDGNIVFTRYSLDTAQQPSPQPEMPPEQSPEALYVKKDDLNKELNEIKSRFAQLENKIHGMNGEKDRR